jgi:hypothetical protein
VPTQCTTIPGAIEGELRYVVLLQQHQTLLKAMMEEIDLTIAFPTQAGQMNVLEIEMTGVRDVLAALVPGMVSDEKPAAGSEASAKDTADKPRSEKFLDL